MEDDELAAVFSATKKKSKKKTAKAESGAAEGEATTTTTSEEPPVPPPSQTTSAEPPPAPADDELAGVFEKKKKKKKPKAEEEGAGDEDDEDNIFSGKKKSSKSKAAQEGGEAGDLGDLDDVFSSKKKSSKSKKKEDKAEPRDDDEEKVEAIVDGPEASEALYTYEELLARVKRILEGGDDKPSGPSPIRMPQIMLVRLGTKKTRWDNFPEVCKIMNRSAEHVFQFVVAELGTEGSIDGSNRLVLRGRYVPKYIESLLRKYILEYVACQTCRSPATTLSRDSVSRLYFVHCQSCGSSRSVAPIRAGFHAQTRADRRALRK